MYYNIHNGLLLINDQYSESVNTTLYLSIKNIFFYKVYFLEFLRRAIKKDSHLRIFTL